MGASIDFIRCLLGQGLAFREHNEFKSSSNLGNFLRLLLWLSDHNEGIKTVSLKNAPKNRKLTSPVIQKDIMNEISFEIINVIFVNLENSQFYIFTDESHDLASKEQMVIIIHYVNKKVV